MTPIDDPQPDTSAAEESEALTNPPASQSTWTPTSESFEKLLAAFASDRDEAGKLYENVRAKLLRYFERYGIHDADECVDITLDRVMRKLDEGEVVANIMTYIYGVASNVCKEAWKRQRRLQQIQAEIQRDIEQQQQERVVDESPRQLCFDQCVAALPIESRALILDYYNAERSAKIKLRRLMARTLGIEMNALRIRAHRIRVGLEDCVQKCIAQVN